jgi:hypothetical protein
VSEADHTGIFDFTPIPRNERRVPGRTKALPARLKIDAYIEHREAFEFLQRQSRQHGQGSRLLVNALLHYRNTVIRPLEAAPELAADPDSPFMIARLSFRAVPDRDRQTPGRVKHVSARLYIDRFVEHREAAEFLESQHNMYGDGLKTVVRSLLHFRDTVAEPGRRMTTVQKALRQRSRSGARTAKARQLTLGEDVE